MSKNDHKRCWLAVLADSKLWLLSEVLKLFARGMLCIQCRRAVASH